ncbi:alanine racemase, partial [Cellulosimicrobium cellulans]|uniref:alanine racemase n=1 Tax=Cellulosimicrobium cellulans TaxID=1710 RepID=UPI0029E7EF64
MSDTQRTTSPGTPAGTPAGAPGTVPTGARAGSLAGPAPTSRTSGPDGPDPRAYPARAVVDLAAVRDNVRALADLAPSSQVMAVVKADAYGHGL